MNEGNAAISRSGVIPFPLLGHCVINLAKPKGISSHRAVERVRKISGIKRAGHAGTLDPMATGVLLVCTGEATKVTRFLSDLDKEYLAVMKLGERTDTYDAEGEVIGRAEGFSVKREDIERVLPEFTGTIEQTPPMYSAIKMGGRPLYKLARKGMTVERRKRMVTVHEIRLTGFSLPFVEAKISCSKGTYIRSLCNDIGEALGVGAHITALERTRIGRFSLRDSITLEGLEELMAGHGSRGTPAAGVSSIDESLGHLRELALGKAESGRARNGLPLKAAGDLLLPPGYLRLKDHAGRLFAVGESLNGMIRIERILHI